MWRGLPSIGTQGVRQVRQLTICQERNFFKAVPVPLWLAFRWLGYASELWLKSNSFYMFLWMKALETAGFCKIPNTGHVFTSDKHLCGWAYCLWHTCDMISHKTQYGDIKCSQRKCMALSMESVIFAKFEVCRAFWVRKPSRIYVSHTTLEFSSCLVFRKVSVW